MCGRFSLTADADTLQAVFNLETAPVSCGPRYNIAPTQPVAVVLNREGSRRPDAFRWGLVPAWAKDKSIGNKMINARAETVAQKPSFKRPLQKQRCLILADGFFEWQKIPGGKLPVYVHLKDRRPFALAGLWECWTSPAGEIIHSCAIITTTPNALLLPVHNRMPVILPAPAIETWLAPVEQSPATLLPLLQPFPAEEMAFYPVSRVVNSPANDVAACIRPA